MMKVLLLACSALLLGGATLSRASACFIGPCESTASSAGGVLLVCPQGDGPTLADIGAVIHVTANDCSGAPVPQLPPSDFWVVGKTSNHLLCNGYLSSSADSMTSANGQTTISGSIAAGGYFPDGIYAVAVGKFVQCCDPCDNPLPIVLVSPDLDGISRWSSSTWRFSRKDLLPVPHMIRAPTSMVTAPSTRWTWLRSPCITGTVVAALSRMNVRIA